ncbi:MAG TPA: transglutaminaseTgpA domain-containing protein [Gaiellaceae bacterium]|nr:transglutaminaseTgpA domain-containing protein [Gaiellaceae bacterium]
MGRSALLALLPALLITTGWQTLEEPVRGGEFAVAAALAVVAAVLPRRSLRIGAILVSGVAVASFAFDVSPLEARPFDAEHDFLDPVLNGFGGGLADFYEVSLPFNPAERPLMHGVVVLAVFAFTLVATLAITARRPILAAATTFAGAAWPVTLVPEGASTLRGVLILAAALLLLAALRPGARPGSSQALLVGAAVVFAALVAVSSPSVAKGGFLDWQQWEPYKREDKAVSVQYVWDSDYDGINFPKTATTVFTVEADRRAPYWRATTLDVFLDDNWQEDAPFLEPVGGRGLDSLTNDPLLPKAARDPENWLRQEVTIEALRDSHLVGASVPVAYEEGRGGEYGSGIAYVGRLERDQRYSVWSYAAEPTPAQLARSRPEYPEAILSDSPFLTIGGFFRAPPFVGPARDAARQAALQQLFDEDDEQAQYEPIYRQARQVVGRPRNPYAAAVALEAWFRSSGDFSYDESPPVREGTPPLVSFVTRDRRGYCQHFAGAMALMLRYLGIPSRVAAGFTSGLFDEDEGRWTVADTNAHTWVEVWFDGYGWLPFDPTPGRGRLRAEYTASSLFFDATGATAAFAGGAAALGLDILRNRLGGASQSPDDRDRLRGPDTGIVPGSDAAATTQVAEERDDVRLLAILLGSAAALLAAFWLLKWGRRRVRYLSDDPRRIAGAVRAELEDYLADQRVGLPPSATPTDLSETVRRRLHVDADRLADALGQARFGPAEEAERAARVARRELRGVLRTMRRRLGARRRLRGLVSLRSLGLGSA